MSTPVPFTTFTATEYANLPDDSITWIIRDLLPAGGSAMIYGPPKARKPIALTTPILTTSGWKTMATLTTDDWVYGPHGKPVRVVAKSDIFYDRPCYELTCANGLSIVCDEDHPWDVLPHYNTRNLLPCRKTTRDLATDLREGSSKYAKSKWRLPVTAPLEYPPQSAPLPLDPYILGAWLGDGTSTGPYITTADRGMRRNCHRRGYPLVKIPSQPYGYRISHANDIRTGPGRISYTLKTLRELNLLSNKHIPERYRYASREDRIELLRGLCDTDGSISLKKAHSEVAVFHNCNPILVEHVAELARGLGFKVSIREGRAKLYGRDCGPKFDVSLRGLINPFTLTRKSSRWVPCREMYYAITAVTPVPSVPVQCIAVDDPQHLFLAGHGLFPTCNTLAAQQMAYAIADPDTHDWLSFPVEAHGPILYLQLDTARVIWKERIRLYRDVNGSGPAITDNIHIGDKQSLPFPFEILNPNHAAALAATCARLKPLVVFVDVLRKATMAEESNSEGMIAALNALELAIRPAALVIISHAKKPQSKGNAPDNSDGDASLGHDNRGSSSLPGNVDGIIKITKKTFSYLGRTIDQNRLKLHWNPETFLFSVDNNEFDAHLKAILADPSYPSDNARAIALSERSGRPIEGCRSALRRKKGKLV